MGIWIFIVYQIIPHKLHENCRIIKKLIAMEISDAYHLNSSVILESFKMEQADSTFPWSEEMWSIHVAYKVLYNILAVKLNPNLIKPLHVTYNLQK